MNERTSSPLLRLIEVMARLRSQDGCPWDREQNHESLKPYLLEEAYEVLESIDLGDDDELQSELGDLLLQVVFHAQIATEEGRFTIDDVSQAIVDKLVRRHPHVFGDVQVEGADEVVANWERIKLSERRGNYRSDSILHGVPKALPALLRAQRIQGKASRVGFDWQNVEGPLDKVEEEFGELRTALECEAASDRRTVEEEFGDLLFSLVNAGRFLDLCPEEALRKAVEKFESRFRAVESRFAESDRDMQEATLEELDKVWEQVKRSEAAGDSED